MRRQRAQERLDSVHALDPGAKAEVTNQLLCITSPAVHRRFVLVMEDDHRRVVTELKEA